MKFINKNTGAILEPSCDMVTEQLRKDPSYKEYIPQEEPAEEKPLSKLKKDELLAAAQAAGIDVPDGSTKAEIVELIQAAGV